MMLSHLLPQALNLSVSTDMVFPYSCQLTKPHIVNYFIPAFWIPQSHFIALIWILSEHQQHCQQWPSNEVSWQCPRLRALQEGVRTGFLCPCSSATLRTLLLPCRLGINLLLMITSCISLALRFICLRLPKMIHLANLLEPSAYLWLLSLIKQNWCMSFVAKLDPGSRKTSQKISGQWHSVQEVACPPLSAKGAIRQHRSS